MSLGAWNTVLSNTKSDIKNILKEIWNHKNEFKIDIVHLNTEKLLDVKMKTKESTWHKCPKGSDNDGKNHGYKNNCKICDLPLLQLQIWNNLKIDNYKDFESEMLGYIDAKMSF